MTAPNPQHLIWIDLEMTGLDPDRDVIIEMATIVTDSELNVLAEGPVLAIHQSDEILAGMDEWNTRQHGGSGLTQRVRESTIDTAQARASRRSAATASARIVASSIAACRSWKPTSTTATWTSPPSRNWPRAGRPMYVTA